jgi:hypothetical protein
MNVLDSELALATLADDGIRVVDQAADADVLLVNTCSVREKAEEKAYSWLGRVKQYKRNNPDVVIGVLGCMAQKEGNLIFRRAPYVDIVAGTNHFTKLDEYVRQVRATGAVRVVLEAFHLRRDPVLLAAEVDDAVMVLVAAALVPGRDVAHRVAAGTLVQRLDQRRMRGALVQVGIDDLHHRPASGRGGLGLDESHVRPLLPRN